jgi:hypothetical protein
MAGVVVAAPRRLAGAHRQHRLAAVERLDLGFLVDTSRIPSFSDGTEDIGEEGLGEEERGEFLHQRA